VGCGRSDLIEVETLITAGVGVGEAPRLRLRLVEHDAR
jgi:hypothetical protein